MRIAGVDPGLTRCGFAIVDQRGPRLTTCFHATLETAGEDRAARLAALFEQIQRELDRWRPEELAVERVHLKGNAVSAIASIQAAGLIALAAARAGLPVAEYSPSQIKSAVAGSGRATKDQVVYMVARLTDYPAGITPPSAPDAADALAVAICHAHSRRIYSEASA